MAKRPLLETPQVYPTDEVTFDELGDTAGGPKDAAPVEPIAPAVEAPVATREQIRQALESRVKETEKKIAASVEKQREGTIEERAARLALVEARNALHKDFPPMTRAELTKNYLAGETAKRAERVEAQRRMGMNPSASPLDQLRKNMSGSYGRGGTTPGATRGGPGFQGRAFTRQGSAQVGGVVPGSAADLAQQAARANRA